jgi:GAF domain-containing protein
VAAVADPARLAAVRSYGLGGHAGDRELDAAVRLMARVLRVPMAVVNLVGPDLQCYPAECGVGAPSTRVPDELSFCAYVVARGAPVAVSDAVSHPLFAANPLVLAGSVAAYLGVPLVDEDGHVLGALGVFDERPREFTDDDVDVLQMLTGPVRAVLSLRRRAAAHEWDARLLAVHGRVLDEVVTGGSPTSTLDFLAAAACDLSGTPDATRLVALRTAVERLTTIATSATEQPATV